MTLDDDDDGRIIFAMALLCLHVPMSKANYGKVSVYCTFAPPPGPTLWLHVFTLRAVPLMRWRGILNGGGDVIWLVVVLVECIVRRRRSLETRGRASGNLSTFPDKANMQASRASCRRHSNGVGTVNVPPP